VRGISIEADPKNKRSVSLEKTANTKIIDCENVLTTSNLYISTQREHPRKDRLVSGDFNGVTLSE
jgi:hypothetical protein